MCSLFKISRSSYYLFKQDKLSKRQIWNHYVLKEIRNIYINSKSTYGSPRIANELNKSGTVVSKTTVAKLMKKHSIKSQVYKKFKVTTNSKHKEPVSPNLLNREFTVNEPSKAWVSDITYIRTNEGWLYLTVIIDLYDRKVIGSSISDRMYTKGTVIEALKDAVSKRSMNFNTIFHSDRGIQYASKEFRNLLLLNTKKQSMSRKGNCWDNAVAESFFSTFKKECVRKKIFYSKNVAKTEILSYLKWYNNERKHSSLGYLSPLEFEIKFRLKNVA